jgi:phospholipid/cholesterol/gamma-HCH transport system substrate-binding protein
MKISNETKVGALSAIAITILILGYNFMKGENLFTSYNRYYASYDDVEGLFKSNPVLVNGYKVGQVSDVQMDSKTLALLVEIKVPKSIKVSKDAIIKIVNTDLIGSKGVHIIMGKSHEVAKNGDTLNADKDQSMAKAMSKLIAPLSEKINVLLTEVNSQIGGDQIKKTLISLNKTLTTVDEAVKTIEKTLVSKDEKLDGILGNIQSVTGDLKSATPQVNAILGNLKQTSEELKRIEMEATIAKLKTVLGDLSTTVANINNGQGSLGKLATDDELYKKLNSTLETFKKLAEDIEKYPSRYTGITRGQRKKADKEKLNNSPK